MNLRPSESIEEVRKFFSSGDPILVTTHHAPDGDAIGSVLAVGGMLEQLDVDYLMVVDDPPPAKYSFLTGFEQIVNLKKFVPDRKYNRVVVVDAGSFERIGSAKNLLNAGAPILNIDHHFSGGYFGTVNVVDVDAAATSEVLFDICTGLGLTLNPMIANGLFVGILTDTGRFRYSNSTPHSLEICAKLIEAGVNSEQVTDAVYYNQTPESIRALASALATLRLEEDGRIALLHLTESDRVNDTEGFVDYAVSISGVELAIFFVELGAGRVKASLRSKGEVDVSSVVVKLGGGGHRKAAGVRFNGTISELEAILLPNLRAALKEIQSSR